MEPLWPKTIQKLYPRRNRPNQRNMLFFMGCYHHAHDPHVCPIYRKGSEERSRKYAEEFDEKIDKLKKEYVGVKSVILMWECQWQRLKKDDPEVKEFMQNTFVQRPKSRLIPRDACKL